MHRYTSVRSCTAAALAHCVAPRRDPASATQGGEPREAGTCGHRARTSFALWLLVGLVLLAAGIREARGADGYDHCTGFITQASRHITTQGTWCLRADLPNLNPRASLVSVQANNVTIDCKGHRMGAVAGGTGSQAHGIEGGNRQNIVVRNCELIGFFRAIALSGNGILVEENVVRDSGYMGIEVSRGSQSGGMGNTVRRNRVYDTQGSADLPQGYGIAADADVLDNIVSGMAQGAQALRYTGIAAGAAGSEVRGNRVSGISASAEAGSTAIEVNAPGIKVVGNHLVSMPAASRIGIRAVGTGTASCRGNTVAGMSTPFANCIDLGGNASH